MPQPGRNGQAGTAVIERILAGFEVDRERDSTIEVPAAEPRDGLGASFEPSQIAVRVSLPSPGRAAELRATRSAPAHPGPASGTPPPLPASRPRTVPNRPLSYTAIAAYEECAYRFQMERVLGLAESGRTSSRTAESTAIEAEEGSGARDRAAARGAAVHSLLEWSQANEWREPPADLTGSHAAAAGLDPGNGLEAELLEPIRAWLASDFLHERVLVPGSRARAEVPLLLGVGGATLRGSIDLLVERDGSPPLVVDYKTDRLGGASPAERGGRYATQQAIYALAVSEARGADEVEVAYVFLERPGEPVVRLLDAAAMERGREELTGTIARIAAGEFPVAAPARRSWDLCRGCPALGRLCAGPREAELALAEPHGA
jgi:hypothetical protein